VNPAPTDARPADQVTDVGLKNVRFLLERPYDLGEGEKFCADIVMEGCQTVLEDRFVIRQAALLGSVGQGEVGRVDLIERQANSDDPDPGLGRRARLRQFSLICGCSSPKRFF